MKSTVIVDINAPLEEVASLFADPDNNVKWMKDIERIEKLSGERGSTGSTYRLIPKHGPMVFTATVVSNIPPKDLRLVLDSSTVRVDVHATLSMLPDNRTRLVSEEVFRFKGMFNTVFGLFAHNAIRKAHLLHIESFKNFAEHHMNGHG
jgi:hypothetical protein